MDNLDFDNKINQVFDEFNPVLNNDELWNNIEPHLKKKKKERRFFIWFLSGLGLLLFGLLCLQPNAEPITEVAEVLKNQDTEPISPVTENVSEVMNSDTKSMTIQSPATSYSANEDSKIDIIQPRKNIVNTIPQEPTIQEDWLEPNIPKAVKEDKPIITPIKEEIELVVEVKEEEEEEEEEVISDSSGHKEIVGIPKDESVRKKKRLPATEKRKIVRPNKKRSWQVDAQFSVLGIYAFHDLSLKGNPFDSRYLNHRNQYVSGIEGFGLDTRIGATHKNGLVIATGIQFHQVNEKLSRQETIVEEEVQEVIQTVTEDTEGNIISTTEGLEMITTTTTYNRQLYNQYQFINVPIGLGYAFTHKKNRFKIIGGIDYNLYFNFRGAVFERNLNLLKLENGSFSSNQNIFNKRVGLGLWTSFEWLKPVNDNLSLVLSTGFKVPGKSVTQEEFVIDHRIYSANVGVGINYLFNEVSSNKKRKRTGNR